MQTTFVVFIGISLDGFIARLDGAIDWLNEANQLVPSGEDCGYAAFMVAADALLMGRKTFEKAMSFDEWPYGDKPVYVFSNMLKELPASAPASAALVGGSTTEVAARLTGKGHRRIYLDGGKTIQSFLRDGLVSKITITTVPVLIGSGLPLFGPLKQDLKLKHLCTYAYPFGFVQSKYAVQTSV